MMAETSPGNYRINLSSIYYSIILITGNTPTTEQSALVIKYDHFGNQTKGKEVTSYPSAEVCING